MLARGEERRTRGRGRRDCDVLLVRNVATIGPGAAIATKRTRPNPPPYMPEVRPCRRLTGGADAVIRTANGTSPFGRNALTGALAQRGLTARPAQFVSARRE